MLPRTSRPAQAHDSAPAASRRRWWTRRSVVGTLGLLVLLFGLWCLADWWICLPDTVQATYVGRSSCVECHATEVERWTGSNHDRAMEVATDESVLGDFGDVEFTHHDVTSRLYRDGTKFMIRTEGPDGELADFEIKYTLGIRPLQQYMVEFDRPADMPDDEIARLQVLRISWDTEGKRWIYVPPPDVPEKIHPEDDLHWTGIAQRWNNMCAYCHSTNLQKNFDVGSAAYRTTFSEIDVSCEACHGPASVHVDLARSASWFWDRQRGYGLVPLKSIDTEVELHTCAPCHSRRRVHAPGFLPGDNYYDYFNNELLEATTYYADGQILDEVYGFGSFIQSKMHHQGIRCTDCHDPHSGRPKHDGNRLCTSCHQHPEAKYDTPAHHFHRADSTGALCVECHMPETIYMEVDPRNDHSIHIPRPDLSVALGTPNACTRCHLSDAQISDTKRASLPQYLDWIAAARRGDEELRAELARLDQWMLESVQQWYTKETWGDSFAYALEAGRRRAADADQQLAAVAADRKLPGIVRASAIHHRGELLAVSSLQPELEALQDSDPQVRAAAVRRLDSQLMPQENARDALEAWQATEPLVRRLVPLLDDPRRVVRAETGRALARLPAQLTAAWLNGSQREQLDGAIEEYITGVLESNDRGGAHLELAVFYETLGREADAEAAYRTALRLEPRLTGPRSNLAAWLDRALQRERAGARGGPPSTRAREMEEEATRLRREELDLLARDARLLPNHAALQYRYGLSLYLHGQWPEAEAALRTACRLEPDNDQFLYALTLFFDRFERYAEALEAADQLRRLRPGQPEYEQLRAMLEDKRRAGGEQSP